MADANDAVESLKLLTGETSRADALLDQYRSNLQAQQTEASLAQLEANQLSTSELKRQQELIDREANLDRDAVAAVNSIAQKLNLSDDQIYVSRFSGEFDAVIDHELQKQITKASRGSDAETGSNFKADSLNRARQLLAQDAATFAQNNPGTTPYTSVGADRREELATPDGFFGVVKKGAATALAGIPGLAGIATSALGAEGLGQTLGGIAGGIQDAAPTDIGSSAASQNFADILARAEAGELSTTDAIRQGLTLGLTDGDFASDLLGTTVGAAAGGGALRAGASGAARLAGANVGARQAATTGAGRFAQEAASVAPAVGVGVGSGVDENLTTGQARLLAGTIGASALTGGVTGAFGGQVAESALGGLAGRVTGRATTNATDDLTTVGALGQVGAGARGALGTGAAEATQEFVEGAGESLGQFAQTNELGALQTLTNPEARSRAVTSGAIQAPLGAGLGGAIGAPAAVSQVRSQNTENRAAQADLTGARADQQGVVQGIADAQNLEVNRGIEGAAVADQIAAQRAQQGAPSEISSAERAFRAQRDQNVEAVRETLVNEIAPTPIAPENLANSTRAERQAAAQPIQEPVTLLGYLRTTLQDPQGLDALLDQGPEAVDNTFRALYRNEVATQADLDPAAEDAFIDQLQGVAFDTQTVAQIDAAIRQAASDAQDLVVPVVTNVAPPPIDTDTSVGTTEAVDITTDPITEVDPIITPNEPLGDTNVTPDPVVNDPNVEGATTGSLVQNTSDGTVIREDARARLEGLRSAKSSALQELSVKDRQSILGKKQGRLARNTINKLLDADPPLTAGEATLLQESVSYLEGEIAAKKPVTPAEGDANSAPTTPPRSSRTTAPNPIVKPTQGSVGVDRIPTSQGLLPSADVSSQPQRFTPESVTASVASLTQGWKKNPDIQVFPTTDSLPEGIRPTDGSLVAGRTNGKTVYLVADQIGSEAQLNSVLQEELFHRGIRNSLGGNYDPQLRKVFKKRGGVDGLLNLTRTYNLPASFTTNYRDVIAAAQGGDKDAELELVDEVLARVAQSPNLPTGIRTEIKQIAAKIKRYLKQFMPKEWFDTVTDADLILMMREATTAGRVPGEANTDIRSSRTRPGDYRGVDEVTGEQVIFNYLDNSQRPETSFSQDQAQVASNYWEAIKANPRAKGLGDKIYNSTPWQGLKKRIADSRTNLALVDNEAKKINPEQSAGIFNAIRELDLPPLLEGIVNNVTQPLEQSILSVHAAVSTYAAQADYAAKRDVIVNAAGDTLFKVMERNNDAWRTYGAALGLKPTAAKQSITRYLNARHAAERNQIAWLKSGQLEPEQNAKRAALFEQANNGDITLREALEQVQAIMDEHQTPENRAEFKGSGMTDAEAAQIITQMEGVPGAQDLLQNAANSTYEVIEASNEIKRQTGSFSNSFQDAIEAYGWTNYVPLRGQGVDLDDSDDSFITHYADNVFTSTYRPFQGRESLTEDVFENVQQIAVSAIEQYAAQDFIRKVAIHAAGSDLTSEYQEAFAKDGFNGKLLAGDVTQYDINTPEFKRLMANKDRNRLIWYAPSNNGSQDQQALVIDLKDSRGTDAVLGAKSVGADRLDNLLRESFTVNGVGIANVTQTTASLKTWRNLPFIPFDALRNTLTLGYVAATEGGLDGFQKYINTFTEPGLGNYGKDIIKFTQLYGQNKFDQLNDLVAAEGEGSTIAELDEFFRLGGPTTQLAALRDTPPGSIEGLTKFGGLGNASVLKKADSVLVPLNAAADTLSRFAFYKSMVDQGVPKDVAAGRAKNTANFEQRGTWSGPLGAAFEFARATSVGATALIDSTLTGPYGQETMAASFGAGVMMYMAASLFAGTDDDGDDNQGKINGKLFNSNFVVQYGDDESDRVQMGLGFGPVAGAMSAGIQAARFALGHQGIDDTFENITAGMANQYEVLPASGISPLTDPISFVANTAVPSILKPLYEVTTNMTGLGIPVRSDYPGAGSGDLTGSFEGRYNSEQEMYDTITQGLSDSGFAEINPDDLRHIMRAYGGTMTHMLESAFENIKYVTGDEDYAYNKKAGFYFARNFIGSEFSQTPSDFYEHYGRVAEMDKALKGFEARGNTDAADAIRDTEVYSENISAFKVAEKKLLAINAKHKDVFRLGSTPLSEKRNTQDIRDAQRLQVYKDYLDVARN